MLKVMQNVPAGVKGIYATGTVTRDDYDRVFRPLLQAAHDGERHVRLLYEFGPTFKQFTVSAGLEDALLGLKYLRLFERCAIVSDKQWIRKGAELFGTLMPCPVRTFRSDERPEAVQWLIKRLHGTVSHQLLAEAGVIVVEPHGPLRVEDFDELATTLDPWIEAGGNLRGIVVHTHGVPGWTNVGSVLRHLRFVRDHQHKVARVALAADGKVTELAPALAELFVAARLKHFDYDQLDDAIEWVKSGGLSGPMQEGKNDERASRSKPNSRTDDSDLEKGAVDSTASFSGSSGKGREMP